MNKNIFKDWHLVVFINILVFVLGQVCVRYYNLSYLIDLGGAYFNLTIIFLQLTIYRKHIEDNKLLSISLMFLIIWILFIALGFYIGEYGMEPFINIFYYR